MNHRYSGRKQKEKQLQWKIEAIPKIIKVLYAESVV